MVNYLSEFSFRKVIGEQEGIEMQEVNNNPCQDQKVGVLENGVFRAEEARTDIDYLYNNTINPILINPILINPIIIILESPHKKEFIGDVPQGPAQGVTGRRFEKNFTTLMKQSRLYDNLLNTSSDVVFVNAVQFQCSLGRSLNCTEAKKTKENNWIKCFEAGGSEDLVYRITAINPIAILNLCTRGNMGLQRRVDCCLKASMLRSIDYTCGLHPSTWNFSLAHIN